jgi:hypothetical protein
MLQEPGSDAATTLCAMGSYDKGVTVWSSAEPVPILQVAQGLPWFVPLERRKKQTFAASDVVGLVEMARA